MQKVWNTRHDCSRPRTAGAPCGSEANDRGPHSRVQRRCASGSLVCPMGNVPVDIPTYTRPTCITRASWQFDSGGYDDPIEIPEVTRKSPEGHFSSARCAPGVTPCVWRDRHRVRTNLDVAERLQRGRLAGLAQLVLLGPLRGQVRVSLVSAHRARHPDADAGARSRFSAARPSSQLYKTPSLVR